MDTGGFLDGVAGGSGDRGNDGTILTEEQVEEAGLTGIREAHESDAGRGWVGAARKPCAVAARVRRRAFTGVQAPDKEQRDDGQVCAHHSIATLSK